MELRNYTFHTRMMRQLRSLLGSKAVDVKKSTESGLVIWLALQKQEQSPKSKELPYQNIA